MLLHPSSFRWINHFRVISAISKLKMEQNTDQGTGLTLEFEWTQSN